MPAPEKETSKSMSSQADLLRAKEKKYNELVKKYNDLVTDFIELKDRRESEVYFIQGILESSPYSPSIRAIRGFNISIYISDESKEKLVEEAIDGILKALDYDSLFEKVIVSSVWRRIYVRAKKFLTEEEVKQDLEKLRKHVENITVNKSQADIDSALADAVSKLMKASDDKECLILLGSLVYLQFHDNNGKLKTISKNLTTEELQLISTDQAILSKPKFFLDSLESLVLEYRATSLPELPDYTKKASNKTEKTSNE